MPQSALLKKMLSVETETPIRIHALFKNYLKKKLTQVGKK